ncbi:MAG TPA: bifunctional transaldolase/phosoglucose isomerase [Anaerolineales bacterium]|nr:bifunctional transaldolase/phosoglucose isomerase [Anaerolineales bacterium]
MSANIEKLTSLGQSLWYDNIERRLLENGELKAMIQRGDIRGMTSNPTIFNNAIGKTNDYDSALTPLAWANWDAEQIFWELAIEDIRAATDLFQPLYEESNGGDGYVSIEVSPFLAHDSEGTAAQAQQLWARVARPNLMVKIPATKEGIPAIRKSIAAGVNVNITLIFSLARYAEVMNAYLSGLEDRVAAGRPIDRIASVASFFVSRVDTKVDGRLPADSPLRGKAAVANAKLAYEEFEKVFAGERWEKLKANGARLQRPLWASTSTKNPAYPDTIYVDNLIGPHTVNTVPPQTLDAIRDHAKVAVTINQGVDQAHNELAQLEAAGISMKQVTQELEDEGVKSFADAFTTLLKTIEDRKKDAASQLGPLADSVSKCIAKLEADSVPSRLWKHDPTLWTTDPAGQAEARIRIGWLDLPESSRAALVDIKSFANQVHQAGIKKFLVLGMGGSSLAPEVFSRFFPQTGYELAILDTTDPTQVRATAKEFQPEETLYIVSSKSGGTAEVMAAFNYFWDLSKGDGSHFIVVTDPGTSLETLAREHGFRKIFNADPNVGGRYSALTHFGLVPAGLLGVDLDHLLARALWMRDQSKNNIPAARNPGLALGAVIGESVLEGRDKLTVLADAPLSSFGSWLEQLIAESSGKQNKGIVPVDLEPVGKPSVYGKDRLFVYLRQTGEQDAAVKSLRAAGFPVLEFAMKDAYDLGAEFYRWEIAIATACHILGVNAFDQPNVQDAKDRTKAKIAEFHKKGKLKETDVVKVERSKTALKKFLAQAKAGNYVAINAYLPRNEKTSAALTKLRTALRKKTGCATTVGFGPRYLHSTGQLHKGGPNTGLFLLLTVSAGKDVDIPTESMTYETLQRAQALGEYEALKARRRRVLRIHLTKPADVRLLIDALK